MVTLFDSIIRPAEIYSVGFFIFSLNIGNFSENLE